MLDNDLFVTCIQYCTGNLEFFIYTLLVEGRLVERENSGLSANLKIRI